MRTIEERQEANRLACAKYRSKYATLKLPMIQVVIYPCKTEICILPGSKLENEDSVFERDVKWPRL